MNKYVIICLLIISVITLLTACNNNLSNENLNNNLNNNQKEIYESNYSGESSGDVNLNFTDNNKWTAKDVDLTAIKDTVIETGKIKAPYVKTNNEVSELYGLQNFEGIESVLIIEDNEETYQEIAIIKLASKEQCDKIFENFISRYQELIVEKSKHAEIINSKQNISMTQQAGIGIMIISPNKDDIVNEINKYF